MSKIVVLDKLTAAKIAAGEVVERPVSVVKELVENSLDAGASRIDVEIGSGGLASIAVLDNGCGIDWEDLPVAFHRHSTSKILVVEDLIDVRTLGFRGEALPSMAAVACLEMITRTSGSQAGGRILLKGGEVLHLGHTGCPPGTAVKITELFFNTPARRKNLPAAATEAGLISDTVGRLALSRSEVAFSLAHNGRVVFRSPGQGNLLDTVTSMMGRQVMELMMPVGASEGPFKIYGFAGHPSLHRSNRQHQIFFVNGRYVRGRVFYRGVQEGYRTMLSGGRHPVVILFLCVDNELVDVNVHPAKLEVRLGREDQVVALIARALKEALRIPKMVVAVKRPEPRPAPEQVAIDLPPAGTQDLDLSAPGPVVVVAAPDVPVSDVVTQANHPPPPTAEDKPEAESSMPTSAGYAEVKEDEACYREPSFPRLEPLTQLFSMYILAAGAEGLYIIDQHAAHERVLFDSLMNSLAGGEGHSQQLLTPVPLEMNYRKFELVKGNLDLFLRLGFKLEEFGEDTMLLRGIPAGMKHAGAEELFQDILDRLAEPGVVQGQTDFCRSAVALMSCRAAIKAGARLSPEEMRSLLDQLRGTTEPYTCPHGRPTAISMSRRELEARFGRL